MAGVRTSVSLIGFGFTVAKFFEGLGGADAARPEAPRNVGFLWQFQRAVHYLKSERYSAIAVISKRPLHSSAYFSAVIVVIVGIAAFGMVWFRF